MDREDLLEKENNLLKEVMGIDSQLAGMVEDPKVDSLWNFSGLSELVKPPQVGPEFYVGNLKNLRPF